MCFFMIRDGVAITPPITNDILESITRASVMELLPKYCDTEVVEREIDHSELIAADEAFFCGTAWEVAPVIDIDGYPLGDGSVGAITRRLQKVYLDVVSGTVDDYAHWRTPVYT